jgi:hypothetical protein
MTQVIANDFLEELATGPRTIDDLGEAEFHLPDGEPIVVAKPYALVPRAASAIGPAIF